MAGAAAGAGAGAGGAGGADAGATGGVAEVAGVGLVELGRIAHASSSSKPTAATGFGAATG
jgi:hypothetical protein